MRRVRKYEKEVEKEKKGRPDEKGNKGGRNGIDVGPERATYLTNRVQTIMAVGVSCAVAFGAFTCTATGLTRPSLADRNSQHQSTASSSCLSCPTFASAPLMCNISAKTYRACFPTRSGLRESRVPVRHLRVLDWTKYRRPQVHRGE